MADGEGEDDETVSCVMEAGSYMAFFEPWDSGDYDTGICLAAPMRPAVDAFQIDLNAVAPAS